MDVAIDHYEILGLEYGATREEIKKAHRKLVLRCLPLPQLSTRTLCRGAERKGVDRWLVVVGCRGQCVLLACL